MSKRRSNQVEPNAAMTAGDSTVALAPPPLAIEATLSPGQWGMLAFLLSEVAFFSTLIVAYITFKGADIVGPTPSEVFNLPLVLVSTTCLVCSSFAIHLATRALEHGRGGRFALWWMATIALGVAFLAGTAIEWHDLIFSHGLTISRNLFGTTYYTLVGLHGLHVTAGLIAMLIALALALAGQIGQRGAAGVELIAWYWHFVDAVWLVVFAVVYL